MAEYKKYLFTFTAYSNEIAKSQEQAEDRAWEDLAVQVHNGSVWDMFIMEVEEDPEYDHQPEDDDDEEWS